MHVDNYDFRQTYAGDPLPPPVRSDEDLALYRSIQEQEKRKGLEDPRGPVRGVLLAPDGTVLDSFHVMEIHYTGDFRRRLEALADDLQVPTGPPVASAGAGRPALGPGDLLLRLTSRFLTTTEEAEALRPYFDGRTETGLNGLLLRIEVPAEQWLVLSREDWSALAPGADGAVQVPPALRDRLLIELVPPTETYVLLRNRLQEATLTGAVVEDDGDLVRIRFAGSTRVLHPWWGAWWKKPDPSDRRYAEASVSGYAHYRRSTGTFEDLALATEGGRYIDPDGCTLTYDAVLRVAPKE